MMLELAQVGAAAWPTEGTLKLSRKRSACASRHHKVIATLPLHGMQLHCIHKVWEGFEERSIASTSMVQDIRCLVSR